MDMTTIIKGFLPVLENFKVRTLIIPDVDTDEGLLDAIEIARKRKFRWKSVKRTM